MDALQNMEDNRKIEFLYLKDTDGEKEYDQTISTILSDITYYDAEDDVDFSERSLFKNIIDMIRMSTDSVTIIVELDHIDASYTDTYYHHFAGLHFQPSKYCKRLSFFQGEVTPRFFVSERSRDELQASLVGTMVIRPLKYGFIGRTLLRPDILAKHISDETIYLRLAKFQQHILGIKFQFEAFPFRSQDTCFMTCAEVTIMNLMEYYSMRYHAYKAILPSDIKKLSQQYGYERVTPSSGLAYHTVSKILSEFGFTPRLYNVESIPIQLLVGDERENEIKRIMHYYIESGVPVAVNVEPRCGESREGHSLLCIGHSDKRDEERAKKYSIIGRQEKHALVNSADFYTKYCVIDDHLKPYEVRDYREMSKFPDMWISNLAVPLYKKMYLEAKYAYDIFYKIFRHPKLGLESWDIPQKYLAENEMVVMRIYQASSRSYKDFKLESYDDAHIMRKALYAELQFPLFVWCAEFFSYSNYAENKRGAFATVILNATASTKEDYVSAILAIETVSKLIKNEKANLLQMTEVSFGKSKEPMLIPPYDRNLKKHEI